MPPYELGVGLQQPSGSWSRKSSRSPDRGVHESSQATQVDRFLFFLRVLHEEHLGGAAVPFKHETCLRLPFLGSQPGRPVNTR